MTKATAFLCAGAFSVLALCSCLAVSAEPSAADELLEALYDAEWAWRVEELAVDPEGGRAQRLGSVPLPTLERVLDDWIAGGGKNPNAG